MFTGELIRDSKILSTYLPPPFCVHTLTGVSWFISREVPASSLGKSSGELGPKNVIEGSSFSPALDPPQNECPRDPLWCSDKGQKKSPNLQVRSRFGKQTFSIFPSHLTVTINHRILESLNLRLARGCKVWMSSRVTLSSDDPAYVCIPTVVLIIFQGKPSCC